MRRAWLALPLLAGAGLAAAGPTWAQAFGDSGGPLHLSASYLDAQGRSQPLEFWRDAGGQVVRRSGGRSELRLTPAPDGEDAYELRDPARRVAYSVHQSNLYRLGLFTDRWSVQHLLDRPRAGFTLTALYRAQVTPAGRCAWWRLTPQGGAASELCWSAELGVPLLIQVGGRPVWTVQRAETRGVKLSGAALPAGWTERNADEDLKPD